MGVTASDAEYLPVSTRGRAYTLMTRKLRDAARISEVCNTPQSWEQMLDVLDVLKGEIDELVGTSTE